MMMMMMMNTYNRNDDEHACYRMLYDAKSVYMMKKRGWGYSSPAA